MLYWRSVFTQNVALFWSPCWDWFVLALKIALIYSFQDEVNRIIPFIVIGIIAAISGTLGFLLPETKDVPTIEVLSDAHVYTKKVKGLEIYELDEAWCWCLVSNYFFSEEQLTMLFTNVQNHHRT